MLRCVVENAPMLGGIRESLGRRPLVDVHTKNVVPAASAPFASAGGGHTFISLGRHVKVMSHDNAR